MSSKKNKPVSRRSFISDTGKTILYGTLVSAAIPAFLAGCKKENPCNVLKEGENGDHYCDDYYICTDSQGFTCPPTGAFGCGTDTELFSCYVVFSCTPENNFYCHPSSSYANNVGGAGS